MTTKSGLFSVLLGSVTPVGSVPDAGTLYLGMAVGGGAELVPRIRIVSAAYAYKADTANYALAAAGGGDSAWVRGAPDSVLFTVNNLGIARGEAGNMLFGANRFTHINLGVACTTGTSRQDEYYCTAGGGYGNGATGYAATVAGGSNSHATGDYATVAGGYNNDATGRAGTVAGGDSNVAAGSYATVAGGYGNSADTSYAVVGGGYNNAATGYATTVSGGYSNSADTFYAAVAGGYNNDATGSGSSIAGGYNNEAAGYAATIGGGTINDATGSYATVGGGGDNSASGQYAAVPGGSSCDAAGNYSLAAGRRAKSNNHGCFTWGDATTSDVTNSTDNRWMARASGGVYFYTNSGMSTGSYLSAGGSSWNSVSDSMTKENFRPVDKQELLEALARMRVRDYNLKSQDASIRHIGPVAQDFHKAFGFGESSTAINMEDADGVALAAIQALYEEVKADKARIAQLEAELARVTKR